MLLYFASEGKRKIVLDAILPLEKWFFTFLMLLPLEYFDVHQLPFLKEQQL